MDSIFIISRILGVYSMILLVLGTLANGLSIIICLRKRLRAIPTFIFMAYMLFCDTISLYFWNLDHFLSTFYGYMIEFKSIHTCKLSTFMQLFSLQSSVWLLVTISIERYLSVQFKNWRTVLYNTKKAAITGSTIIILSFLLNLHLTATIDYDNMVIQNYTAPDRCFYTTMFLEWKMVHTYLYSIIPFILLIIVNGLLIYKTIKSDKKLNRSNEEKKKRRLMSLSIVGMSVSFIILTLPNAVAGGYFIAELFQTATGTVILFVTDCLAFSYHGFNFAVFLILNKNFRKEFNELINQLKCFKRRIVPVNSSKLGNTHTMTVTAHL